MILSSPNFLSVQVTEMNDPLEGFSLSSCDLLGNYLIFTVEPDRDVAPEEPSSIWVYELTEQQRDKLRSYEANERSISVEWCYTHHETQDRLEEYEWLDLSEDRQEDYVPNFDISL